MGVRRWLITGMALLCVACGGEGIGGAERTASHLALLNRAPAEWDRLFNTGALDALAEDYEETARSMPPGAPTVVGREAIRRELATLLASGHVEHATTVDHMEGRDDLGIELSTYVMTIVPKDGAPATRETGRHVMARRWHGDQNRWLIAWEIWNSDQSR